MPSQSIRKVLYGTNSIQKNGRVQIPRPLLRTMELDVGDEVEIILDVEKREIILKVPEEDKDSVRSKS